MSPATSEQGPPPARGRGAPNNPPNRFAQLHYETDAWCDPDDAAPRLQTIFLDDDAQSVLAYNQSPDVGFAVSLNCYRGCEHGCAYCYARPTHEFLGFSAGTDFESKILVKRRAAELLRAELGAQKWVPQTIALSGVTDPYQPIEKRLLLTRACLTVLAEFRNPVSVITKNFLVTRDLDLLQELAGQQLTSVTLSITSLHSDLARRLEPRAATPAARLEAIRMLAAAGVPTGIALAPIIPGLNDHEIPAILEAAAKAGARFAFFTMIRLPLTVTPIFVAWLEQHFPERASKVLDRIREMRGGHLNDARFGRRMRGDGVLAQQISQLFRVGCRRAGLSSDHLPLNPSAFRRPPGPQLDFAFGSD